MKSSLFLALGIVSSLALTAAQAQTYQWKDGSGRTVISDTPPPGGAKGSRSIGVAMPTSSSEKPQGDDKAQGKPADAPKSTAEKDMEFRKRQQEAREKAEKAEKEQTAAREKQDACDHARRNLAVLESAQPLTNYDDKGERQLMDAAQREQEMARLRKFMADTCK